MAILIKQFSLSICIIFMVGSCLLTGGNQENLFRHCPSNNLGYFYHYQRRLPSEQEKTCFNGAPPCWHITPSFTNKVKLNAFKNRFLIKNNYYIKLSQNKTLKKRTQNASYQSKTRNVTGNNCILILFKMWILWPLQLPKHQSPNKCDLKHTISYHSINTIW